MMEDVCPACEARLKSSPATRVEDSWYGYDGTYEYFVCSRAACRTLVQQPPPSQEALAAAYEHYFTHGQAVGRVRRAAYTLLGTHSRLRSLRLPFSPHGVLLDVGCGDGRDMLRFQEAGWSVVGVDSDPLARAAASARGLSVYEGFNELPEELRPAVVVMRHVIEHARDPVGFLEDLKGYLSTDGLIVMVTPNALALGRGLFGRWWRGYDAPRHLQVFTPQGVHIATERGGYNVDWCETGETSLGGLASDTIIQWLSTVNAPPTVRYVLGRGLGLAIGVVFACLNSLFGRDRGEEIFVHARPR